MSYGTDRHAGGAHRPSRMGEERPNPAKPGHL
jgi:hypothetical protein